MSADLVAFLHARLDERERRVLELLEQREYGPLEARLLQAIRTEIEAARRVIEAEQGRVVIEDGLPERLRPEAETTVLRLLALPYREHPDYRPEWAP